MNLVDWYIEQCCTRTVVEPILMVCCLGHLWEAPFPEPGSMNSRKARRGRAWRCPDSLAHASFKHAKQEAHPVDDWPWLDAIKAASLVGGEKAVETIVPRLNRTTRRGDSAAVIGPYQHRWHKDKVIQWHAALALVALAHNQRRSSATTSGVLALNGKVSTPGADT